MINSFGLEEEAQQPYLKPCPHCGKNVKIVISYDSWGITTIIKIKCCSEMNEMFRNDSVRATAEYQRELLSNLVIRWNKRV